MAAVLRVRVQGTVQTIEGLFSVFDIDTRGPKGACLWLGEVNVHAHIHAMPQLVTAVVRCLTPG